MKHLKERVSVPLPGANQLLGTAAKFLCYIADASARNIGNGLHNEAGRRTVSVPQIERCPLVFLARMHATDFYIESVAEIAVNDPLKVNGGDNVILAQGLAQVPKHTVSF